MFVSLGCSFSRGERLFYHRWKELYNDSESLNDFYNDGDEGVNPEAIWYRTTTKDLAYQSEHTACGLLAKKLGCEYILQDGTNKVNLIHIEDMFKVHDANPSRKIDFFVLQLTEVSRDLGTIKEIEQQFEKEEALNLINNTIPADTCKKIFHLNQVCKDKGIGFYVWSWQNELAYRLLSGEFGDAEDFFVKIEYEGKEYFSFNDMVAKSKLDLALNRVFGKYGATDGHPNLLFNEILCDSLFKKIRSK